METIQLTSLEPRYLPVVGEVYELLKQGAQPLAIYQHLLLDHEKLREGKFKEILEAAYQHGEAALQKDREYLFMLHVGRYEDLYHSCRQLLDHQQRPLDRKQHWSVMVQKLRGAAKALKCKEDLLGLHDRKMVLELIDQQAFVVEQGSDTHGGNGLVEGVDLIKLTVEELVELVELVEDARSTPIDGVQRVIIKQRTVSLTQDGTPLVTEETTLIDDVKVVDAEWINDLPDDVLSKLEELSRPTVTDLSDPNLIDDVPKEYRELQQRSVDDLKQQIHEGHQEKHVQRQALDKLRNLTKKR